MIVGHNLGLGQLFYSQVKKSPENVALIDGKAVITYANLHARASNLAEQLIQWELSYEEPVGIIVRHGAATIVAQMAVIYAGGTCVPIDPSLPDLQIQNRLTRLDVRCILIDQANRQRDLPYQAVSIDDTSSMVPSPVNNAYPVIASLKHRTHIVHTSGTTNHPKAVQIAARSILHAVFHYPCAPLRATDVVAHTNNSSFDLSLFDIWAPLLRGGRIAVLSKAVLLDPYLMAQDIDRFGITVMPTTTAIFNLAAFTYPQVCEATNLLHWR